MALNYSEKIFVFFFSRTQLKAQFAPSPFLFFFYSTIIFFLLPNLMTVLAIKKKEMEGPKVSRSTCVPAVSLFPYTWT